MTRSTRRSSLRPALFTLAASAATLAAGLATPANALPPGASQPTEVLELFTSQGCSSCPPANDQIAAEAASGDALALSYGVTYWDYLGWTDTFASPEYTERQRAYVKALGARTAYTPQIVRNGTEHSSRLPRIDRTGGLAPGVALEERGGGLVAQGAGEAVLIAFAPGAQEVAVKRGENGGRTLSVSNVVEGMEPVSLPHTFAPEAGLAYAVLQHGEDMALTSAAAWLPEG